jgi:hypothetical protein
MNAAVACGVRRPAHHGRSFWVVTPSNKRTKDVIISDSMFIGQDGRTDSIENLIFQNLLASWERREPRELTHQPFLLAIVSILVEVGASRVYSHIY